MKLIDADKLYEYLDNKYPCDKYVELEDIFEIIEKCQTVNAIKIPPNAANAEPNELFKVTASDKREQLHDLFVEMITRENAPSVKPEHKRGKWVKYCSQRADEQHYQCTNCKNYVNFGAWGDYYTKDFKYCPHCGAEMEGK